MTPLSLLMLVIEAMMLITNVNSEADGRAGTATGRKISLPPVTHPTFQKGFTYAGWSAQAYMQPGADESLAALAAAGVEWVALVTSWFQTSRRATEIAPHPVRTPTDESLRHAIRQAHRLGLRVMLKPQIDLLSEGWRGQISFTNEADWQRWFASYIHFIAHYADLAKAEEVELLCIGVELDATRHREADWRRVIAVVRQHFPGPLTYAANWNREADIAWWDALDYAGVDAYFPLADKPGQSAEALKASWRRYRDYLRKWQARTSKPVLFTEIGYRSVTHAAIEPWEWQRSGEISLEEQARLYQAALEMFWSEPWFFGFYWWQWPTQLPQNPAQDDSFTPYGKPAWNILRAFYALPRKALQVPRRPVRNAPKVLCSP